MKKDKFGRLPRNTHASTRIYYLKKGENNWYDWGWGFASKDDANNYLTQLGVAYKSTLRKNPFKFKIV